MKKRIQTLSFFATLAIAVGMISWGTALNAQDAPTTTPDRQAQQPSSSPDTTPSQQTPQTAPTPSPEMPQSGTDSSSTPSSSQTPSQTPDSSQTPDATAPSSRTAPSGNTAGSSATSAGTDSQTFSGTVTKQGDKYVLKDDAGKTYDIDHQDEVKKFDGKRVRVQGTLDPSGSKIMVK